MANVSKFTSWELSEIHRWFAAGRLQVDIAREFKITQGYVSKLKKKWEYAQDEEPTAETGYFSSLG